MQAPNRIRHALRKDLTKGVSTYDLVRQRQNCSLIYFLTHPRAECTVKPWEQTPKKDLQSAQIGRPIRMLEHCPGTHLFPHPIFVEIKRKPRHA